MSCITEILKRKGAQDYMVLAGAAIEDGGTYKGYEYLVTFTARGHRCGYVAISKDHPTYRDENDYPDFNVHGGITFFDKGTHLIERALGKHHCDDLWLGFDAMHSGDGKDYDLVRKVYANDKEAIRHINSLESLDRDFSMIMDGEIIRSKEYMIDECKNLIDQLIEIKEAA